MKMKKFLSLFLCLVLFLGLFTACGETNKQTEVIEPEDENTVAIDKIDIQSGIEFITLDEKPFSVTEFAKNKLTMVNIWGTFCGPCINEMPELAKLSKNLPDGVAMLSICSDAYDDETIETAKSILADNGCDFVTLISDENIHDIFLQYTEYVPTTLFIDKDGNVVDSLVGATDFETYSEKINACLDKL